MNNLKRSECSLIVLAITMHAVAASAATVTVDNLDSGFSIITASSTPWQTGTSTTPYGADYRFASTTAYGGVFTEVEWRPAIPTTGTYTVSVWYGTGSNRATNAPFTVDHAGGSTSVSVNQQANGGQWYSIGTFTFNAGTAGRVRLHNDANNKVVIADAVQFVSTTPSYNLTMAVSPSGAGTTTPAAGTTSRTQNEVVSITASPNTGYAFSHWTVSGGSNVASPASASTTVTMDQTKTVTAVFVQTSANLTMAVSPVGGGAVTPTVGTTTRTINEVVTISAVANSGYTFDHWEVSAGSAVASPTSASTTVTMDQSKTVTAIFVSTAPVYLTMVVTPIGAGTVSPTVGGPYARSLNQSVGISASANSGFVFDHWTTTAGSAVASPNSSSTTVTMDQSKTVIAVFRSTAASNGEIRAFWAVVFQEGYKTAAQVDTMIAAAVAGRYNMIIAQMLAYQDSGTNSHGAYWNSQIVPKATDISPSSFDPLAYLCEQAHANGIEVHAMSVPFRMCTSWPPNNNDILTAHPEWFSVKPADIGCITPRPLSNGIIVLDPGNPEAQEYLLSIMREWLTNYPIDGIHWDLEYVAEGYYPTHVNTPNSSLARFKQITGYSGTPATTYAPWQDFRRRVNTEIISRAHAEILGFCTPTRQIRQSASLIAYGDIEATFAQSEAYAEFSDWERWTRMGYLDTAIPMNYDREHDTSQKQYFRNAIPQEMIWKNNRELVPGLAHYLNYFAGSLDQITYCRSQGTAGIASYDYWYTRTNGTSNVHDTTWYTASTAVRSLFTTPVPVPTMKWRDPATATEGTVWGRVTDVNTGLPIDNASVQVGSLAPVQTDGNGYYTVAMANATSTGTSYTIIASKSGYPSVTHSNVNIVAGNVQRDDFALGATATLTITQHPAAQNVCPGTTAQFTVAASGGGTLIYQWQKNGSNLSNGGHYSGVTTTTLTVSSVDRNDTAGYQCVVTDGSASVTSNTVSLSMKNATSITQHPTGQSVAGGGNAQFSVTAAGSGTLSYQWQKDEVNLANGGSVAGATTATLSITGVSRTDLGYYRCVVTADCGSMTSNTALLTVPADTNGDLRVDSIDFDAFSGCYNGPTNLVSGDCLKIDFNGDQYVDSIDFDVFSGCYNGPTNPPGC